MYMYEYVMSKKISVSHTFVASAVIKNYHIPIQGGYMILITGVQIILLPVEI